MHPEQWVDEMRNKLSSDGTITLSVKVIPHARRTQIVDVDEHGILKIKVTAPAEKGKANMAIVELLAELFETSISRIKIIRGFEIRNKIVQIII